MKTNDITGYVTEGLKDGSLSQLVAIKNAPIMARRGMLGEKVTTYTQNGLIESERTIERDPSTGNLGWIVTKVSNDFEVIVDDFGHKNEWIVTDSNFIKNYQPAELAGIFRPIPQMQKFVIANEDITFTRTDGKTYSVEKGGYLNITNLDKIRVISKRDFDDTYEIISDHTPKNSK